MKITIRSFTVAIVFASSLALGAQSQEDTVFTDASLDFTDTSSESDALITDYTDQPEILDTSIGALEDAPVPEKKRPRSYENANSTDTEYAKKTRDTIEFGIDSEISDLVDELQKEDDTRFVNELYDLFQVTKSSAVREKILSYFSKLEDPCLEDFAVETLNDPFDCPDTTVELVFNYVSAIKSEAAVQAVHNLIENENDKFFVQSIRCMGNIGNSQEAVYLSTLMDRDDLAVPQRQELIHSLGKLKANETFEKLAELAQDEDENGFIRKYSAQAIGAMENPEAVPILVKLFEDNDPNLRVYVIKGLSYFNEPEAQRVIIQGIRDNHYSVRLESINAVKEMNLTDAVPYLIYRAKNDSEKSVKQAVYPVIAKLNTQEGNEYLVSALEDKKLKDDTAKAKIAAALMEYNNVGTQEIIELAQSVLKDDKRKALRYALGKEFAKYERPGYAEICMAYLDSKDVATQGTGLDIYAKNRFPSVTARVEEIASQEKESANQKKAKKILEK